MANARDIMSSAFAKSALLGNVAIALRRAVLDGNRAAHGVDDRSELDEDAVAGALDDAAAMLGDGGIDEIAGENAETLDRPFFVDAGQPAIAHDIRGEDRGQPSLDSLR